MKAPIYLQQNGRMAQITIEQGLNIVTRAKTRSYVIEGVSGTYGGDVIVTVDNAFIKFPAHYGDALDMLQIISPTPKGWYIENGYLPPDPTLEDEIALQSKFVNDNIAGALEYINQALEEQGKLDDLAQKLDERRVNALIKIAEIIQAELGQRKGE